MSSKNAPEATASDTAGAPLTLHWSPSSLSLATRLTAWYGGSAFSLIAVTTAFLYWALISNLDREDDEFLADKVNILRVLLRDRLEDSRMLKEEVEWEPTARQYGQVYVRILDRTRRTVLETPGMRASLPVEAFPNTADGTTESARGIDWTSATGASFRLIAARITGQGATTGSTEIQVALDRTREEELLARYRRYLWLALGLSLVLCMIAGYQIARRGLRPLRKITEAAGRIRSTTLHERMETAGLPGELAFLAGTFNEMLDRLKESFERLERFSADIAHELRNPVNNLRGEAEVALGKSRSPSEYREVLSSCLEECGRLSRMIDNLLFVARTESPQAQMAWESADIGKELASIREFYEAAATEAGIDLVIKASPGLIADVDPALFQRAIGNLVSNALAHTPSGGVITVAASADDASVRVDVWDTGEGIPREHLPHVFDRFYRADKARATGAGRVGLGLAIVKAIATLHGGTATITSEVGKGTRASVSFPRCENRRSP
jgi:two-component system heavy metal sensor histidine kinase CusS